ncbi:hypothetical protein [Metabacillus sp. Hm71]|uniref:hypothetical protein n=1 Tax=Metabacillus sp. Hm71 TaxID=3450743 RepID=UPI003F42CCE3
MDAIDKYINRLDGKGTDPTAASINKSKRIQNDKFTSSPSFTIVKVNGVDTDSIINNETKYDEKLIHFRPDTIVNIGSVVEYKAEKYLLLTFFDDPIYPKGKLKLCNSIYTLPGTASRTQTGVNDFGEPIYEHSEGTPTLLPCIAETSILSDDTNEAINLPEGTMQITIPFTEHADLVEGKEFTMYGTQYQIIGIDYTKSFNGVGLLVIKGKKV